MRIKNLSCIGQWLFKILHKTYKTEIRWDHLIPADLLLFPAFKIAKGV